MISTKDEKLLRRYLRLNQLISDQKEEHLMFIFAMGMSYSAVIGLQDVSKTLADISLRENSNYLHKFVRYCIFCSRLNDSPKTAVEFWRQYKAIRKN